MNARRLQPEEYPALAAVSEGFVPNPANSIAVVVEKDGQIVGRMLVLMVAHVEGTWVADGQRGGTIGKRLMDAISEASKAAGLGQLMAYSESGEHDAYLHRLGFERMPWTVWKKELK